MHLHNLETTDLEIIATAFNKAFEGYFVPIKLDAQLLADKIKSENIVLECSVGVTINNELAGFILIGIDAENHLAYNAGTGTIPSARGQKLTEKMYSYLLPKLKNIGIRNHLLEVICENNKALKIYEKLGYSVTRKLICYKGNVSKPKNLQYKIRETELPNDAEIKTFWNHNPTYQNSTFCIKNNPERHTVLAAFDNGKLIGYILFDKNSLRIKQFGIDNNYRNKKIGHQLFYQVQLQNPDADIVLINIDENDFGTNAFLQKIGFKKLIEQSEMTLKTN